MNCETRRNLWLCGLLVTIAVAGRWIGAYVDWSLLPPNFTPVAAIGLFAGFLFANRMTALLVPLIALAISNLALDSYGGFWMGSVVYASFMAAPLLGRWLRNRPTAVRAFAVRSFTCDAVFCHDELRPLADGHPTCRIGLCRRLAWVAGLLCPRHSVPPLDVGGRYCFLRPAVRHLRFDFGLCRSSRSGSCTGREQPMLVSAGHGRWRDCAV